MLRTQSSAQLRERGCEPTGPPSPSPTPDSPPSRLAAEPAQRSRLSHEAPPLPPGGTAGRAGAVSSGVDASLGPEGWVGGSVPGSHGFSVLVFATPAPSGAMRLGERSPRPPVFPILGGARRSPRAAWSRPAGVGVAARGAREGAGPPGSGRGARPRVTHPASLRRSLLSNAFPLRKLGMFSSATGGRVSDPGVWQHCAARGSPGDGPSGSGSPPPLPGWGRLRAPQPLCLRIFNCKVGK